MKRHLLFIGVLAVIGFASTYQLQAQRAVRGSSLILDDNGTGASNNKVTLRTGTDPFFTASYELVFPLLAPSAGFNMMVTDSTGQMRWISSNSAQNGYTLVADAQGIPQWTNPSNNVGQWSTSGNAGLTDGVNNYFGTLDPLTLNIITGGTGNVRMTIDGVTGLVSLNNGMNLAGSNSPLQVNGDAGIAGSVFISGGPGTTPSWSNLINITNNTVNIGGDTLNIGGSSDVINQGGPNTNQNFYGDTVNINAGNTFNTIVNGDTAIYINDTQTVISGDTTIINAGDTFVTNVAGDTSIYIDATTTNISNDTTIIDAGDTFVTTVAGDTSIYIDATTTVISNDTTIIEGDSVVNIVVNGDTSVVFGDTTIFNNPVTFGDTVIFNTLPALPLQENYMFLGNASNVADTLAPGADGEVLTIVSGKPTWSAPTLLKGVADPNDGDFTVTVIPGPAVTATTVINITHMSAVGGGAYVSAITPGAAGVGSFTVTLPGPADPSDMIQWTFNP